MSVAIACYGDGAQGTISFDDQVKMFTYIYGTDASTEDVSFDSQPEGPLASASEVTISQTDTTVVLKAHIVGGDGETPLIATHAEAVFNKNADGAWIFTSGSVYHMGQYYSLDGLIGHSCYVQSAP